MPYQNTQKNQSTLLSKAKYRGPSDVSGHCLALGTKGLAFKGPSLTHITSRRELISESDNNYQEEYTQNDFFCDFFFMLPQHKEEEITASRGQQSPRRFSQELGSSIKFAMPCRCR